MHKSKSVAMSIIAVSVLSMAGPATAGCLYPSINAAGPLRSNIQSARYAAMSAWEHKAARSVGRRYGAWDNAGDQVVACAWNDRGNRIRCQATATACTY